MAEIDATDNHMGRPAGHGFIFGSMGPDGREYCDMCGRGRRDSCHIKSALVKGTPSETLPDAEPSYEPMTATDVEEVPETIAEEASRIVYGDREKAYDDPNQNFRRIAKMWTGTLDKKLAPGCEVTPRDVALMFIQLKISREAFMPKRDNRVDIIGYALCLERIVEAEEAEYRR